ncbi:COG2426 family protein [Chloroflexota bacterium]
MELSHVLAVMGIAASPISELRGAIPFAVLVFDYPWYYAYPISVIGNLMPIPFILLFLEGASRLFSRIPVCRRLLEWLFARTRRRGSIVERYQYLGLVLFVAIPLPFTGAWTGSLAAVLFGLRFWHSLLSIGIGVIIAGAVVTSATMLGWNIIGGLTQ